MTDLLSELEAVVGLAEKATPGPWVRSQLANVVIREWRDEQGLNQVIAGRPADDWLCTAAVNFLRTHHAEIAAAVRDAAIGAVVWQFIDRMSDGAMPSGEAERILSEFVTAVQPALSAAIEHDTAMRAGEGEG